MKYLFIVFGLFLTRAAESQSFKAMTYNIRYDNAGDGENQWIKRRQSLLDQVQFYEPDFLGIQEGLFHQVNFLDSSLVGYSYVGVGRDDGKQAGEFSAVFYRSDKFTLKNEGTFWLSETPESISVGWDAAMERICTYGQFRDLDGNMYWVFNTHFDHIGIEARNKSARLILSKIDLLSSRNESLILMGDFNLEPNSDAIKYLSATLSDSKLNSPVTMGPEGTFNGFNLNIESDRRIDYIFSRGIKLSKYAVLVDLKEGRFPSDHFPVIVYFNH